MFEVISGTYEDFRGVSEPSCKYVEGFDTFEEALAAYDSQSNRVWAALYMGERLVMGFSPL